MAATKNGVYYDFSKSIYRVNIDNYTFVFSSKLHMEKFKKKRKEHAEKINASLTDPDEPQEKVMYCVQVGAFSKYENAVNMRNMLSDKGFNGYITKNHDSSLYRVQVGAFSIKKNASNYALELSSKGFDCYVKEKETL